VATILVVDDEVSIVDLLRAVFEDEGYRVLVAHNGQDALRVARAEHPDLVLSDVRAPDNAETWMVTFVSKPFAIAHVLALVARFVVA